MERPVGEIFYYYGHHYVVAQDELGKVGCKRCVVEGECRRGMRDTSVLGECQGVFRSDLKEVHFEIFGVDF